MLEHVLVEQVRLIEQEDGVHARFVELRISGPRERTDRAHVNAGIGGT
jgi:hypothetical protein